MSTMLDYAKADAVYVFEYGRRQGWHVKESLDEQLKKLRAADRARHELRIAQLLNGIESKLDEWTDRDEPWSVLVGISPGSVNVTSLTENYYIDVINDYFESTGVRYRCMWVRQHGDMFDNARQLVTCKVDLKPFGIEDL